MRRWISVVTIIGLGACSLTASAVTPASTMTSSSWPLRYAVSVDPEVAQFSPDGARLVVHGVEVWRVGRWRLLHTLTMSAADSHPYAYFSPDGTKVVTFGPGPADPRIWDAETGRLLHVLRGHTGEPGVEGHTGWTTTAVFNGDSSRVVTAGWDRTARIWDARSGRSLLVLRGHTATVETAVFSPDGTRVATAGADATVRVWDAKTGRSLLTLRGGTSAFFSPNGRRLVTSNQGTTIIWDLASGRKLQTLTGHASTASPDGRFLPLADHGQTRILDMTRGVVLHAIRGAAFGFSPDSTLLVTDTGWDRQHRSTVALWNTATGRLVHTVRGRTQYELIETAIFSPSGEYLLTNENRIEEVLVWKVATGRLVRAFS